MTEAPIVHLQSSAFSSKAFGLSIEESSCLNHSLMQLKLTQKLPTVQFWGKLLTVDVNRDYYIALMFAEDPFSPTVFYCQDTMNWVQAPAVTEEEMKAAGVIRKSFSGDPAFEHLIPPTAGLSIKSITESKRIVAVVKCISQDVRIIPRGAHYRDGHGRIQKNEVYQGLKPHEINALSGYVHFRVPETTVSHPIFAKESGPSVQEREDFEASVDLFESIEKDTPNGTWTVHQEGFSVFLSSLLWPGYHHYSSLLNGKYTDIYCGTGKKNSDLGFML